MRHRTRAGGPAPGPMDPRRLTWCLYLSCALLAFPSVWPHGGWSAPMPLPRSVGQLTFFTAGIVHDPSMIEGLLSLGQYIRSIKMNFPGGAGSQLDSLAAPGESFWIWRSTDPSALALRSCRALIE